MGYWEYLKDRLTPIGLFAAGMCGALSIGHDPLSAFMAAWIAVAFFFGIFSVLWLLSAIIGRKPRRDLSRLSGPRR